MTSNIKQHLLQAPESQLDSSMFALIEGWDADLEDMYQYEYPKNVKWLIEIRKDFIEKHHPEELLKNY